ncbi:hypothetical protein [Amycolatopsis sp. lyj-109]|uniref:hypothetical protein n=1 Tax=Amycolatopsis sp. lyj-109 TaxID=2789287 RepID=UPI00397D9F41
MLAGSVPGCLLDGAPGHPIVGEFLRDVVLATKYSGPGFGGGVPRSDPRRRSNGRKNMIASLEASLRRLSVDHVELCWLHI